MTRPETGLAGRTAGWDGFQWCSGTVTGAWESTEAAGTEREGVRRWDPLTRCLNGRRCKVKGREGA